MHKKIEGILETGPAQWTGAATVERPGEPGAAAAVAIERSGQRQLLWATPLAGAPGLRAGDEVLILCDSEGRAFVVDRLAGGPRTSEVRTSDGASARVEARDGRETLVIRSPGGEVVAEHDASTGRTRVRATEGAIEIEPSTGLTHLAARGVLALDASVIALRAKSGVLISSGSPDAGASELHLTPGETSVRTRRASVQAERTDVRTETMSLEARRADGAIGDARLASDRVELSAESARTTLGTLIHTISGAARVSVGRMALYATTMLRMRSERTDVRSKKEFKIDGSRIHLG